MEFKIIELYEDKTKEIFASADCQQLLNMYADFYPKIGFSPPWVGYFIIRQTQIVGSCSFLGPPKDGKAEVAYWTFKEFEGQGIASLACRTLVALAYRTDASLTITAKTAPEKNASTKILQNTGFIFSEIVQDSEIGDAWLWTHQKKMDKS